MPIYMEISRLHRTVTIVARGRIDAEEIRGMAQKLAEAKVRPFAKIVEVAGASTYFAPEQIVRLAEFLRGASSEKRGPVAFVIDPEHTAFPRAFAAQTQGEGPIRLFQSLREARDWVARSIYTPHDAGAAERTKDQAPGSDMDRSGVMFRRGRQRGVIVRSLDVA